MNIDLLKFSTSCCIDSYVNDLSNMNFTPFSVLPTQCVNNSLSIIDHIFCNFGTDCSNGTSIKSLTVTSDISDHYANVFLIVSNKKRVNYSDRPMIQIFTSKNISKFKNQLSLIDWTPVYNSSNIRTSIAFRTDALINVVE